MSETIQEEVRLLLVAPDPELSGWFLEDIGGVEASGAYRTRFADVTLVLKDFGDEVEVEGFDPDVAVGVIRFVDVLSLKKLNDELERLREAVELPLSVFVYRNENEEDFKMSCPYCGQKLWVRDADKDKRGRCPHCKKGFTLPEQEEHVARVLGLSSSVQVRRIFRNDPASFNSPMRKVLELTQSAKPLDGLEVESGFYSKQTMNVDVELLDEDDE